MEKLEQKSALRRSSFWVAIGLLALAGVTLAMALGAFIPTVPGGGPYVQLPNTLTVTTTSGKQVTLNRGDLTESSQWVQQAYSKNRNEKTDHGPFTIDSIDSRNYVTPIIPVTAGQSNLFEPLLGDGSATTWRTRITIDARGTALAASGGDKQPDVWQEYYAAAGSGLPAPTSDQLDKLKPAQVLTTVTSRNKTVLEIDPVHEDKGDPGQNPGPKYYPYAVYFDFAALHGEGKTSLTYPLAWYASPFVQALPAIALWLTVALGLAALIFFYRIGAARAAVKRREWEPRQTH
jgi:hypothetical protein